MGWKRRFCKTFYYRSERSGRKVRSRYVGAGFAAQAIVEWDAIARAARRSQRDQEQGQRGRMAMADDTTKQFNAVAAVLVKATLLAAGFHRSRSCPWRKRMVKRER